MLNDIRYGIRVIRQNPGFAMVAILCIAIAIGANSAIFALADGLLFRPLAVSDASNIVSIRERNSNGNFSSLSYADYLDFREKSHSFDGLVAYNVLGAGFAKDATSQPRLVMGYLVSGNLFDVLGIHMPAGRAIRPEEDVVPGRDAVVVLSHDFWKSELGSDPAAVGRHVRLNGLDFVVIGVAPESFSSLDNVVRPAFYAPAAMIPKWSASLKSMLTDRTQRVFNVKGRLKKGISITAANAEVASIAGSLEETYPDMNRMIGAAVRTEMQARLEIDFGVGQILTLLFSLGALVLAISCANVANLMLNRGKARIREIAIRRAIGAGRGRIVRQLMVESLLIAAAGGGIGLLLAQYAVDVFSGIEIPGDVPVHFIFQLDRRVLLFTAAVSFLSAVLFGLIPAFRSTDGGLVKALKTTGFESSGKKLFGRRALVVIQITACLLLLAAAAQFHTSMQSALLSSHGFRTDHRISMRFSPSLAGYSPERSEQFYRTILENTRHLGGVQSASLSASLPMTTDMSAEDIVPEDYEFPKGQSSEQAFSNTVSDGYFETLGVPMIAGRGFSAADRVGSPQVAVVNEKFAKEYFKGNAVGKRFRLKQSDEWIQVVGVTVTGKYSTVFEPDFAFFYLASGQHPQERLTLVAQTYGDPAALAGTLRDMVRAVGPEVPVFSVRTMDDLFNQRSVQIAHIFIGVVAVLGMLGLAVALVGLYAVVAYQVTRSTREIGIRMALGAAQTQVLRMVLKQAGTMAIAGVGIGIVLTVAASSFFTSNMVGPQEIPMNWQRFAAVCGALLLTTSLAAVIPARRASRIAPTEALRQD
jgi:predicted permease